MSNSLCPSHHLFYEYESLVLLDRFAFLYFDLPSLPLPLPLAGLLLFVVAAIDCRVWRIIPSLAAQAIPSTNTMLEKKLQTIIPLKPAAVSSYSPRARRRRRRPGFSCHHKKSMSSLICLPLLSRFISTGLVSIKKTKRMRFHPVLYYYSRIYIYISS